MFPQRSTVFFLQETSGLNAIVTTRSTYDESRKICPRRTECERTKPLEPPPVPYVPDKDEVQEEVTKLQNLKIKTTLKKDTTVNIPVWHENGTQEAFLMHVMVVLVAIKKRGTFKDYKKVQKAYVEAMKAAELAEAGLALLDQRRVKKKLQEESPGEGQGSRQRSPCERICPSGGSIGQTWSSLGVGGRTFS
jgi:hypothetical protein